MARYADPQRCPDCGAPIPGPSVCPSCGLNLAGPVAGELFVTLQRADALLGQLRAASAPAPSPAPAPAPAPSSPMPPPAPSPPPGPAISPSAAPPSAVPPEPWRPEPYPAPQPGPATPAKPRRVWTVPMVLLTLGGVLLVVGAVLFLALAWSRIGVGGRTALLGLVTVVAGWSAQLTTRRGLRGAAETLAGLTVVLAGLVCVGARYAGWFGDTGVAAVLVGAGLTVGLLALAGDWLLERATSVRLWSPQLTGGAALDIAAVAALVHFPGPAVTAAAMTLAGIAVAYLGRLTGQSATRWNAYTVTAIAWLVLAGVGLGRTLSELPTHAWSDLAPLLAAGALAAVLVPPTRLVAALPGGVRVAAGVVAA
ncbi:zinc ribbon domain-containing protein, partial [Nocardioides sp.]|uniref:zinc ribbon domain-containing protein n=1 Tax=Nocardioides sp. TaxID=35761 RepID=UPI0039E2DAB0